MIVILGEFDKFLAKAGYFHGDDHLSCPNGFKFLVNNFFSPNNWQKYLQNRYIAPKFYRTLPKTKASPPMEWLGLWTPVFTFGNNFKYIHTSV
jgi:hypothetical protein